MIPPIYCHVRSKSSVLILGLVVFMWKIIWTSSLINELLMISKIHISLAPFQGADLMGIPLPGVALRFTPGCTLAPFQGATCRFYQNRAECTNAIVWNEAVMSPEGKRLWAQKWSSYEPRRGVSCTARGKPEGRNPGNKHIPRISTLKGCKNSININ